MEKKILYWKNKLLYTVLEIKTQIIKSKAKRSQRKSCLLVSNEFSLTGAPRALLDFAQICRRIGFYPVVLSQYHGPLEEELKQKSIDYLVVEDIESDFVKDLLNMNVAFTLVNTVVNYQWVEFFQQYNVPVFWWLHECNNYLSTYKRSIPKIKPEVHVLCVSTRAKQIVEQCDTSGHEMQVFPLGIPDEYNRVENISNQKKRFLLIGTMEPRKNQLEFIDAIARMKKEQRRKAEFIIIGSSAGKKRYYHQVVQAAKKIDEIVIKEALPHEEMMKLCGGSDCVVCTSLDETGPIVLMEAMMLKKVTVSNRNTGIVNLIDSGENGFLYRDVEELSRILSDIIDEKYDVEAIGEKARATYLQNFEYGRYVKRTKRLLQKYR